MIKDATTPPEKIDREIVATTARPQESKYILGTVEPGDHGLGKPGGGGGGGGGGRGGEGGRKEHKDKKKHQGKGKRGEKG